MNPLILAQEIIDGRRITRKDDLSFFLTCDLDELCEGADRIREAYIGDKVDLCSIINGRSGRCPEDCKYSLVDMGITPHIPTQNRTCAINAYGFSLYIFILYL